MNEDTSKTDPDTSSSEVIDLPSPSQGQLQAWEPTTLASLSDAEFQRRMEMAAKERKRIAAIQRAVMVEGVDYGTIPGIDKPTLFKPGAEVLNKLAGYTPQRFEFNRITGDGIVLPHIQHEVKCYLQGFDGQVWCGAGSSNSWEKKYRYRTTKRVCPKCNTEAIIKGQEKFGGGWVCWKKVDGCGAKFNDDDKLITSQEESQEENPDPYDLDNTLLKMAKKRAFVDATLIAHAASGIFTQDMEATTNVAGQDSKKPQAKQPGPPPAQKVTFISEAQAKRIFAIAISRNESLGIMEKRASFHTVNSVLKDRGFDTFKVGIPGEEIKKHLCSQIQRGPIYEAFCGHLERWKPKDEEAPLPQASDEEF